MFWAFVQVIPGVWILFGDNQHSWTLYGHNLETFWIWTLIGYILVTIMVTFCQNMSKMRPSLHPAP